MQTIALLTLLLVASVSAAPSQSEQQASNTNSVSVQGQPQNVGPHVGNSPIIQPVNVGPAPNVDGSQVSNIEQPPHHQYPSPSSYYSPAGMVTVVGGEQGQGNKPVGVRGYEQYGQPESASLPPNYKPFGSWGLYIGGNPADGYYTNYYKALTNSVSDKQQVGEQVKPNGVGQAAAFSPIQKQAGSSPYVGGDFYPIAYSPSDLSSGIRQVGGVEQAAAVHSVSHAVGGPSPVQVGSQVYGSPAAIESNYGVSPYADFYATKKVGSAYTQKEAAREVPSKGYQSRVYVYPSGVAASPIDPSQAQQVHGSNQQHIVAYPVPVGSQIVGSQPGVDGAFNPYGVHAFTRYAVKPTMVNSDPSYYYGVQAPSAQVPSYKQVYTPQSNGQSYGAAYYPMSYYGYPMNQLHYSQGSIVPSVHSESHHGPIVNPQIDGVVSEKAVIEDKSINKQQKRA